MAKKEKKTADEIKTLIAEQKKASNTLQRKLNALKKSTGFKQLYDEINKVSSKMDDLQCELENLEEEDEEQEAVKQLLGGEASLTKKWLRSPSSDFDCDYLYVLKQDGEDCNCLTINLDKVDDEPEVYKEDGQLKIGAKGQTTIGVDWQSLEINWIAEEGFKIVSPLEIVVSLFAPEALIEAAKKCSPDDALIIANNKIHRVIGSVSIY